MPRKAKTEETVVTEENILHEDDMEMENVPVPEETGMDGESPDTLSVDAGTDFSAAAESAETSTPAEPVSTDEESAGGDTGMDEILPEETAVPDEPVRKETIPDGEDTDPAAETAGPPETPSAKPASKPARKKTKASAAKTETPDAPAPIKKTAPSSILTLSADAEVETPESREDTIWHELQNAYRTRKILTGTLGGIEKMEGGGTIAVVYYKEMRVVIPLAEMMINLVEDAAHDYGELVQRQNKILGNMLGCELTSSSRDLTMPAAAWWQAGRMPCIKSGRFFTFRMPMETPAYAKTVSCRRGSLPSRKRWSAWRFSVRNVPSSPATCHGTGWEMPPSTSMWASRSLSAS